MVRVLAALKMSLALGDPGAAADRAQGGRPNDGPRLSWDSQGVQRFTKGCALAHRRCWMVWGALQSLPHFLDIDRCMLGVSHYR